jgi:spore maturation protein CgeB
MSAIRIVVLGLSITSSWGNGHATTYRGLVRELVKRGHQVLFLERDVPWYAANRDLPRPPYGRTTLYRDVAELRERFAREVRDADLVIVGSYVPEGVAVGDWVQETARGATAFYDIDTPVTLAKLARGDYEYLAPAQIRGYDLYLSFTGGPTLEKLEREYGSPAARVLYCSFDPELYFPDERPLAWDLGYMGTYSDDRQPTVQALLVEPARLWPAGRFTVAGPQYPADLRWPANVEYTAHLPPAAHRAFYNRQRYTLNVTRADMIAAGWSPSVRLFEAAACATPIVSDRWAGIESLFAPGREILLASKPSDVLAILREIGDDERRRIGERARARVLAEHTAAHRAQQLEGYALEAAARIAA